MIESLPLEYRCIKFVLFLLGGHIMIGGRFPAWALALCAGIILALVVGMTTKSDKRPHAHFVGIFYDLQL